MERVFKTAWFSKAAKKAGISDRELCRAIAQVMLGQADDLGGGVYKKRLGKNLYRSIVLAKGGKFWVFEFLFAKQDRANIDPDELVEFRRIASHYSGLSQIHLSLLIEQGFWKEICYEAETEL